MKKGTILSIDDKFAYVFTSDCCMVKVNWQPDMVVGEEINMETSNMESSVEINPAARRSRLKLAVIAASLVLLLAVGLIFGQGLWGSPVYATLSVDVNPSLEMSLNRELKVISVQAMNEDASQLLVGHDLTGLDWQEAVGQWIAILRQSKQVQVQNMLISAVMPDNAEQLRTQLANMEQVSNQGDLAGVAVRVIYSYDQAVAKEAKKNGLSVGRQMLLNQARLQNQNWDETNIESAPLGDLIQNLLQNREQNQTRLTERTTQSVSDQTGETTPAGSTETNRETNRETSRETSGNTQGSATGSQVTNRETNRETSGSKQVEATGSGTQQTNGSAQGTGSGTQQASCESSSCTTCESSQIQQTSQIRQTGN